MVAQTRCDFTFNPFTDCRSTCKAIWPCWIQAIKNGTTYRQRVQHTVHDDLSAYPETLGSDRRIHAERSWTRAMAGQSVRVSGCRDAAGLPSIPWTARLA